MQIKDNILFTEGMNKDDDPRFFGEGDYLEARNMNVVDNQDQGDEGLVQKLKSTIATSFAVAGYGFEHYGVVVDEENDMVYLFSYAIRSRLEGNQFFFMIHKYDVKADTVKIILKDFAATWNINPWDSTMQKLYNPVILNNHLTWTDNVNDIRMIDVSRIEVSTDIGLRTNDDTAVEWDSDYAFDTGYTTGELVYYLGNLWIVLQNTVGAPVVPVYGIYYNQLDGKVEAWDGVYGNNTGYQLGDFVYYLDKVYYVLQSTIGVPAFPEDAPAYYEYKCQVVDCYLDISDPNNFTLAALPPLLSIVPSYETSSSRAVNKLRGRTFQFTYRYVYIDWRKSTYAPPSIIAIPLDDENENGEPTPESASNNMINLAIPTGNEEVRVIEIIARDSDDPTTWYKIDEIVLIDELDRRIVSHETDLDLKFFNDILKIVVDQVEVFNLFSFVPIRAKHMELIEGNRLVLGNITEGYSKINSSVTISTSYQDVSAVSSVLKNLSFNTQSQFSQGQNLMIWVMSVDLPELNPGAATFTINLNKGYQQPIKTLSYVYNGTDPYPSTVKDALVADFISEFGAGELSVCFDPSDYRFCMFPVYLPLGDIPYQGWARNGHYVTTAGSSTGKYRALSKGFTHSWGIVYRDKAGRLSPIVGAGKINKYIPFITESPSVDSASLPIIDFNINHLPPDWADSYEIVYSGNKSASWLLQLVGYEIRLGKRDHSDGDDVGTGNPNYRTKIAKQQRNCRGEWDNWRVEEYEWEEGDRLRIIGIVDNAGILSEYSSVVDVEVTGVYEDTDNATPGDDNTAVIETWVYFKKPEGVTVTGDNIYVELYRVKKDVGSELYFTTGMTFNIETNNYGDKYHAGNTDQTLTSEGNPSSPAIVRNTSHDSWLLFRNFRNEDNNFTWRFWAESQYISDWYESQELTSSGNPIPDLESLQQNILTKRLRHGGAINIGTQVNNISDFKFDDFLDLKDEHGPIEGLRLVGFVLKVLQYIKVSSVYISRRESFNAASSNDYQFTDDVFGTVRPAEEDWGTAHPDSVVVHNRHLYFWDQSEGIVVRDAANGMIAISDYKMNRYFKDLARSLDTENLENQRVYFSYSMETEELICLFGNNVVSKELITFSEKNNRWKRIIDISFDKGVFFWLGKRYYHVQGDSFFEWWKGTDYLIIGDNAKVGLLEYYSKEQLLKPKLFNGIIVYQTGDRPKFNSVIIPEKATSVQGEMETRIYDANINEREGVFYCQILNDINDPRPLTQNEKLINGRYMRGLYAKIEMKFEGADKTTLSNVIVLSTPSERST